MRIESYEDALSNIELSDDGGQLAALLGEEYLIHYMVDLESRGSLLDVEAFSNPFAYTTICPKTRFGCEFSDIFVFFLQF